MSEPKDSYRVTAAAGEIVRDPAWHRAGATLYTLKQEGWRRGEPFMVNDHTALVQGPDAEAVAISMHAALAAYPGVAAGDGGDWVPAGLLDFLDGLAENAAPGERKALNPIIIGLGAKSLADKVRTAAQRPAAAQAPETAGGDLEELRRLSEAAAQATPKQMYFGGNESDYNNYHAAEYMFKDAAAEYVRKLLATPSAALGGSDRERVARIIDPSAAEWTMRTHDESAFDCGFGRRRQDALAKADAILALAPQLVSPGAVERVWHDGCPPKPWSSEWFIAKLNDGEKVVLRELPEYYHYDFKTADDTYIKKNVIKSWMQFQDSVFLPFAESAEPTPAPKPTEPGGSRMGEPDHPCPMCGAYSPRSCDLEDECGGVCPWVESGQYERDCLMSDDEEDRS